MRLSAGLKHCRFLKARKLGRAQESALAPIFAPLKSKKCLERSEIPTETLAMWATPRAYHSERLALLAACAKGLVADNSTANINGELLMPR